MQEIKHDSLYVVADVLFVWTKSVLMTVWKLAICMHLYFQVLGALLA